MVTIYKTLTFESAHILKGHPKCGKLHGHSYKVEVWLTGELTKTFGFVLDFHTISDYFKQFDHSDHILDLSAEKMAMQAASEFLKPKNIKKVVVRIWETATAYAQEKRER
jgi:6-pyruvoyltetrahydropterin/6-carboxytetrahydropterin synthase